MVPGGPVAGRKGGGAARFSDKSKYTDWTQSDDIKAELKVDLILVLAEHGYPSVDRDEVYKEIFEQAENFKKYREQAKA